MKLSSVAFHHAFKRFQAIHRREDRRPLDSFRNPRTYAYRTEDYKEGIVRRATAALNSEKWKRRDVGSGRILEAVIAAIELPGNNLLQWDARYGEHHRIHAPLHDALKTGERRKEFELLFAGLYAGNRRDQQLFDHLIHLCGRRYELIAYLYFVADWTQFLPIRTTWFDRAFVELDLPLRTARQCSWDNYRAYLAVMRNIQEALGSEGIGYTSLLDAHSFCWLLATDGRPKERRTPPRIRSRLRLYGGIILESSAIAHNGDAPASDRSVDMALVVERRTAVGRAAEEIALCEEQQRLTSRRRTDLAKQVELVSDRPGLGYDIRSFEPDGTVRHIEVKRIGRREEFFLSENEWRRSRRLPNYWFYLVSASDGVRPRVEMLPATELRESHLRPTQYVVRLGSR